MKDLNEQYICNNCGFTSPVPNDFCPECHQPMAVLNDAEAHRSASSKSEDDDDLVGGSFNDDGTESLEDLRAKEEASEDDTTDDDM